MLRSGLTDQSVASGGVDAATDQILAQTGAMLVLSSTGGILTADGNEQTLYIDNNPLGAWEPLTLWVDLDAMDAGDTTVLRIYHRTIDGGGLHLWNYQSYTGADGGLADGKKIVKIDLAPNRHGFWATLEQTAGVNRGYPWELFARV